MRISPSLRMAAAAAAGTLLTGHASAQWTSTTLTTARFQHAAAAVGTEVLVAGGQSGTGVPFSTVEVYDVTTGTWSSDTLSAGRFRLAATAVGSEVLFAGGNETTGASDVVDIYDATTGTWTTASLSAAREGLIGTTVGDKALFAGGTGPSGAVVDVYDESTGTWTVGVLSLARSELAATAVGDKAMFAGGFDGANVFDTVDVYDDVTGTWTTASLSLPRAQVTAATVGTKAFFAGGSDGTFVPTDRVDIYDDVTGTWSTASLSVPRSGVTAVTVGSLVLFAGGLDSTNTVSDVVDVYDDVTGTWTTTTLPSARFSAAACAVSSPVGPVGLIIAGIADTFGASDAVDIFAGTGSIGTAYCTANPNSTGVGALISATGSELAVNNDVRLTATRMPNNAFGYFLTSQMQASVPNPGGSEGILCLGGSIGRYVGPGQIQNSGVDGSIALQIDLTMHPTPTGFVTVMPGETWSFQAWYRDTAMSGAATSNLSDGVEVTFQ